MSGFVLDASVALSWYLPGPATEPAREWQRRVVTGEGTFRVPPVHWPEVAHVLRRHVGTSHLARDLAERIWQAHQLLPIETVEPARDSLLETAFEFGASAYDASYISLALETDATLLTIERPTRKWLKKLGDRVVSLKPS